MNQSLTRDASSEIHDLVCVGVDGDGSCHGGRGSIFAVAALVRPFAAVVLLLHQMIARSERHQVSIISRCGDGHRARTPDIRVTQLVG